MIFHFKKHTTLTHAKYNISTYAFCPKVVAIYHFFPLSRNDNSIFKKYSVIFMTDFCQTVIKLFLVKQ